MYFIWLISQNGTHILELLLRGHQMKVLISTLAERPPLLKGHFLMKME